MYKKESKKKLQGKGKLMDSKKYKSMTKEEIIRKLVGKKEALKNLEEELSENKKLVQEKDNLCKEYLKHLVRLQADLIITKNDRRIITKNDRRKNRRNLLNLLTKGL